MAVAGVVGRDAELAEVEAFLSAVGDGFAALVLEGVAGIGKTTVWREARERAGDRGMTVLGCRPSASEAKFSFAAVADLLSGVDEAAFAVLPEVQRDALEVALLRRRPNGRAALSRAVAAGFLGLVRELAQAGPLVLAIDDAQWLDQPSRSVLDFAVRRLEREQIGLLCSVRSPTSGAGIGAAVAVDRLRVCTLGPLSLAALGRIVAARLGRSLPRPLLGRIATISGGNPFYALEIGRLLVDRGVEYTPGWALPVPEDLLALATERIRRLPKAAREALLLASVLSAPDRRTVDPHALAAAEEAEIVRIDAHGTIEFTHPLFASALLAAVPSARRREAHRRAAELVSEREERARHLALAWPGPDAAVAHQLDDAAALAASRGAPDAAAGLAELAAELTPAENQVERAGRLLSAARFHLEAGDLERAEELANEAGTQGGSDTVRARALALLAHLRGRRSTFAEAIEVASTARELAGGDDRLRAEIELELGYSHASIGNLPEAARHAGMAVEHAERAADDGLLAEALATATIAEFMGGGGLATERLARAVALEDPARVARFAWRPRYIQGNLLLWVGEVEDALETYGVLLGELATQGQEGAVPMLLLYVVWACLWHGELDRAAVFAAQAHDAAMLLDDPTTQAIALGGSALVHAHDGRGDQARADAVEALRLFERLQWKPGAIWPLWALGLAGLAEGDPAAVDSVLGPLTEQTVAIGVRDGILTVDPVLAVFLPDEVEALVALGEIERAEAYLQPFERIAARLDRAWAIAAGARCRGMLLAATGSEPGQAFAAFDLALSANSRTAMPLERARTLLLAGQTYRRYKQRARARELLGQALAVFEGLGAPLWAARAGAQLERVGGRAPSADELTAIERRVAELAVAGLSNREVAERAFVSVKTVEAALTRVYRKLGVRSRSGLAGALKLEERAPQP